jgi:hypothetical protein
VPRKEINETRTDDGGRGGVVGRWANVVVESVEENYINFSIEPSRNSTFGLIEGQLHPQTHSLLHP